MSTVKNALLFLASILITIFILELFLFFEDYHPNYEKYELIIGQNKYMVNDNPVEFFKDTKEHKAVFIGDSFTVNEVCAHKKKDFVNLLKNKYESNSTSIYNFAIGNTGIAEYAAVFTKIVDQVDQLVIVLYYNDIFFNKLSCENISQINDKRFKDVPFCDQILKTNIDTSNDTKLKLLDNFLEKNFNSFRLLKEALINVPLITNLFARSSWNNLYLDETADENKVFINLLKYIKEVSDKKNVVTNFLYFPDVAFISDDNKYSKIWETFIIQANKEGVKIHNPWEYFLTNSEKTNLTWSYIDDHPNCEANQLMHHYFAENISKFSKLK